MDFPWLAALGSSFVRIDKGSRLSLGYTTTTEMKPISSRENSCWLMMGEARVQDELAQLAMLE